MKFFQDTAQPSEIYSFDDDVIVNSTSGVLSFVSAEGMQLHVPATLQRIADPVPAAPQPTVAYVPAAVVRQRLQDAELWGAVVGLMSDEQKLWFATLQFGIDPADQTVAALLQQVGADKSAILAPA